MQRRSMLDLSTSHLTAEDGELLTILHHGGVEAFRERAEGGPLPCYGAHEYGGTFWVDTEFLDAEESSLPWSSALVGVLRYARGKGFDFVLFDADARLHPDLPTFHW
jgi:hypothetical protein